MNKIGPDYIGLLVLGVFNAAIGRQNIRSDLQYKAQVNALRRDSSLACNVSCSLQVLRM